MNPEINDRMKRNAEAAVERTSIVLQRVFTESERLDLWQLFINVQLDVLFEVKEAQ